jgi:hypothetical protein
MAVSQTVAAGWFWVLDIEQSTAHGHPPYLRSVVLTWWS